jgi:hypothetical protein
MLLSSYWPDVPPHHSCDMLDHRSIPTCTGTIMSENRFRLNKIAVFASCLHRSPWHFFSLPQSITSLAFFQHRR